MKANYDDTKHSRTKREIYNSTSELFFTAITYFCIDRMGYNKRKTFYMLEYIQKMIEDLNGEELKFQEMRDDLKENYGIVIEKKSSGIHIVLEEEKSSNG